MKQGYLLIGVLFLSVTALAADPLSSNQPAVSFNQAAPDHGVAKSAVTENNTSNNITTTARNVSSTAANEVDTDLDGLTDALESQLGTDPKNSDTDTDSFSDGEEYFGLYQYTQ